TGLGGVVMRGSGRERAVWFGVLLVLAFSMVFVGSASAALNYGINSGKQCVSPLNVGDQLACTAEISNNNSNSHDTVTTNQVVDVVTHPNGTTASTITIPVNSSTVGLTLIMGAGATGPPTCDASKCTIPYFDAIDIALNHYTVQPQDVGNS